MLPMINVYDNFFEYISITSSYRLTNASFSPSLTFHHTTARRHYIKYDLYIEIFQLFQMILELGMYKHICECF
jgi:hypothetical protein